jgi:hypothetical protein
MQRIMLAIALLGTLTVPAQAGQVYDVAADFSITTNPDGVWSYGYETTLGSTFVLYDAATPSAGGISGLEQWYSAEIQQSLLPTVGYNNTDSDIHRDTNIWPPHEVFFQAGFQGQYSVIRWTAPTAGTYNLAVSFRGDDNVFPTTSDVHVLYNGNSLFSGQVDVYGPAFTFSDILSVKAGDIIDFAVGVGSDGSTIGDMTGIGATISSVPEPSGLLLIAIGVGVVRSIALVRSPSRRLPWKTRITWYRSWNGQRLRSPEGWR